MAFPVSLPLRERGLKSSCQAERPQSPSVAPLAGAWIEICKRYGAVCLWRSLPLRERGLK